MKKLVVGLILLLFLAVAAYFVYGRITFEKQDFSPLAASAKTDDYQAAIQRIRAHEPGVDGFTFAVMGDSRSNFAAAKAVFTAVANEKPSFILDTGDLVRRGRVEEYVAHHLPLVKMLDGIPFVPVPGNHEEGPNKDYAAYKALYGDDRFSFDYGDCRFVGVNNTTWLGMSGAALDYLDRELGKPGAKHKYVVFHVPPKRLDVYKDTAEGRGFTWHFGALQTLLKKHGVECVFMGHVHGFATTIVDGVRYVITGGAGAPLAEQLPKEGAVYNFLLVHVAPDGVRMEVSKLVEGKWIRSAL